MKNIIKCLFLITINCAFAQVSDTGNNVGIGTTTPSSKLTVEGNSNNLRLQTVSEPTNYFAVFNSNYNYGKAFSIDVKGGGLQKTILGWGDVAGLSLQPEGGNVGIGTTNPSEKLDINGSVKIPSGGYGAAYFKFNFNSTNVNSRSWVIANDFYSWGDFGIYQSLNQTSVSLQEYSQNCRLHINKEGNVGIGTTTPDAKLAVNGNIHTKEVKVDLIGWSDFVFESNYTLPSLKEVEQHIKEKGHLKDIPSAEDVKENGIFLGEMDSKLLQKIEELTLYAIQQEKKINSLEKLTSEIKELKKENTVLKSLVERLGKIEEKLKIKSSL